MPGPARERASYSACSCATSCTRRRCSNAWSIAEAGKSALVVESAVGGGAAGGTGVITDRPVDLSPGGGGGGGVVEVVREVPVAGSGLVIGDRREALLVSGGNDCKWETLGSTGWEPFLGSAGRVFPEFFLGTRGFPSVSVSESFGVVGSRLCAVAGELSLASRYASYKNDHLINTSNIGRMHSRVHLDNP